MENPMAGIDEVEQIQDPTERAIEVGKRMAAIPEFHARLKQIRRDAVVQMKDEHGMSFGEIATALGLHRGRAQQIYEGRSGGRRRSKPAIGDAPADDDQLAD
ncbi:hypothetical protein [Actinoplanes sp. NPDC051851]|uniref:hypothetical protein n=1 Tax=Actinoplanes sp. NPDC051851 TaxID=3154753 RepID=UPI003423E932